MDRAQIVHKNFLDRVKAADFPAGAAPAGPLAVSEAVGTFHAQVLSRALDLTSRAMQKAGEGFYTIGSSGHEGMAAVARALRPTDMAFLHYRDAAFQIARADQVPGQNIAWDMLLSFACSREDPTSGGRHKVLGSKALMIPPQTSTIASHLPKAVGAAYSIGLAKRQPPEHKQLPDDAIVTNGAGNYASWLHRYYRYRNWRTQLAPTSGSMGYGLPAAVAAKLARPEQEVVCLAGDGCYQMVMQEFGTAAQYGASVIVLVCDNGMYGTIRMHQQKHYPKRPSGTTLVNPDFAMIAGAYGGFGATVTDNAGFEQAFAEARRSGLPALLHLKLDPAALSPKLRLENL